MIAAACCLLAVLGGSLSASDGIVRGRVVDARTNAGLAAAIVVLDDNARTAHADADGRFEFRGVTPGSHRLTVRVPGFSPSAPVTVDLPPDAAIDVELPYALAVATEVRGAESPTAPVSGASLGRVTLRGRDITAAVGGLDDVARVLQVRPGAASSQDDRNDILVRGGGALETQVVMDGFELPTASHFGAVGSSGGGISLIPPEIIETAVLETGGFGVAHGDRASAVVRIEPRPRPGEADRVAGAVSAGAGGVLALAGGPALNGGAWTASLRRSILETAFSRGSARAVPRYADLFGRFATNLAPGHSLRVLVLGAKASADVEEVNSARGSVLEDAQDVAFAGVGLRSSWTGRTSTSFTASFSTNEIDARQETAGTIDGRELAREGELRLRAEVRRVLGRAAEFLGGVTVRRTAVSFDLQDGSYRNAYGIYVAAIRTSWHDRVTEPAAFVEASVSVARRLTATAGGRVERPGMSGQWFFTPRARVEWDAAGPVRVIASAGTYRQALPFIWIASYPSNASLPPIRAGLGTLGVEARGRWGRVAVEGFLKRYTGYPVDPAEPPRVLISAGADYEVPFVGRLVGDGRVRASGIDASGEWGRGTARVAASYSWWKVRQRGLDLAWRPGDFDMRHQARVIAGWQPRPKWTMSASWRYASGRPYTPFDVAASIRAGAARYDRTQTNALNYAPYARADLRVSRVFTPGRTVVTVFGEILNLSDHDNLFAYTWSRSARRSNPVYQWGRTPVAGVRVEF